MNVVSIFWKSLIALAAAVLVCQTASADDWQYALQDNGVIGYQTAHTATLMTFTLSASVSAKSAHTLDLNASYKGLSIDTHTGELGYRNFSHAFKLNFQTDPMDFSADIRRGCERSPQQLIGDMIIDGALGVNIKW